MLESIPVNAMWGAARLDLPCSCVSASPCLAVPPEGVAARRHPNVRVQVVKRCWASVKTAGRVIETQTTNFGAKLNKWGENRRNRIKLASTKRSKCRARRVIMEMENVNLRSQVKRLAQKKNEH